MTRLNQSICFAIGMGLCQQATAVDWNFNGFGSIVAGQTSAEGEEFAGYDNDFSMKPDSKIGIQISADMEQGLSATVQLTANAQDGNNVEIEWAYLSYDINDSWNARAGRLRAPVYMFSSSLDVGYSYLWIRPPSATYALPFSNFEGVDISYSTFIGDDWYTSITAWGGVSENEDDFTVSSIGGLAAELSNDWFTGRLSWTRPELDASITGVGDVNFKFDYFAIGGQIDYNNFIIIGEYTYADLTENYKSIPGSPTTSETTSSWYATLGYRINNFTPNITYEKADASNDAVPGFLGDINNSSVSLGVRWDFHPQAAAKAEYTVHEDKEDSTSDANLFAFGIDFVF